MVLLTNFKRWSLLIGSLCAIVFAEANGAPKMDHMWIRFFPQFDEVSFSCKGSNFKNATLSVNRDIVDAHTKNDGLFKSFNYNEFKPAKYECEFTTGQAVFTFKRGPMLKDIISNDIMELSIFLEANQRLVTLEVHSGRPHADFKCRLNGDQMKLKLHDQSICDMKKGFDNYLKDTNQYSCVIDDVIKFEFDIKYADSFPKLKDLQISLIYDHRNRIPLTKPEWSGFDVYKGEQIPSKCTDSYESSFRNFQRQLNFTSVFDFSNEFGYDVVAVKFYNKNSWNLQEGEIFTIKANLNENTMHIRYTNHKDRRRHEIWCILNDDAMEPDYFNKQILHSELSLSNDFTCHWKANQLVQFSLIRKGFKHRITRLELNYGPNGVVSVKCGTTTGILAHTITVHYQSSEFTRANVSSLPNEVSVVYYFSGKEKPLNKWICRLKTRTGTDEVSFRLEDNYGEKPIGHFYYDKDHSSKVTINSDIKPAGKAVVEMKTSSNDCTEQDYLWKSYTMTAVVISGYISPACGGVCYDCYKKSESTYTFGFNRIHLSETITSSPDNQIISKASKSALIPVFRPRIESRISV